MDELIAEFFIKLGDATHIHPLLLFGLLCVAIAFGCAYLRKRDESA